jgi:hypothetical protein
VRALDLSGCERVILSACGSGAPYVDRTRVAPSLSDAFLDSGAGAVIHTFLDVREDEAVAFTRPLLAALDATDSPVTALNRARRESIARAGRAGEPAAWAMWSVAVRGAPGRAHPDERPETARRSDYSTTKRRLAMRTPSTSPR